MSIHLYTSFCYAITASEATRGAINLKRDVPMVPKLATAEILSNSYGETCRGYHAALGLEWIKKFNIAPDSEMPLSKFLDSGHVPKRKKAKTTSQYSIDEWECIANHEDDIKSYVVRQPVIISVECSKRLFDNYCGGIVDADAMLHYYKGKDEDEDKEVEEDDDETYPHSMLLTGFGFYFFNKNRILNFWEFKNSVEMPHADNEYLYFLRNSSQSVEKHTALNPLVPLCYSQGERYDCKDLVKDLSLMELEEYEGNSSFDLAIMFYSGDQDERPIFLDFRRASRFYLTEKDDVIFAAVNVTGKEDMCAKKYDFKFGPLSAAVVTYKNIEEKNGMRGIRDLTKDRGVWNGLPQWTFTQLMEFLLDKLY